MLPGLVTLAPGGLGEPSGPTTGVCLEWLDAVRMKAGESWPDREGTSPPCAPGSYGPGDRKAAGGAPEGDAPAKPSSLRKLRRLVCEGAARRSPKGRRRVATWWRLSALHPLACFAGDLHSPAPFGAR